MTNYDVEHTIKKRLSGDVRDVFVAIGNWWGPKGRDWGAQGTWPDSLDGCGLYSFLSYSYRKRSTATSWALPMCDWQDNTRTCSGLQGRMRKQCSLGRWPGG